MKRKERKGDAFLVFFVLFVVVVVFVLKQRAEEEGACAGGRVESFSRQFIFFSAVHIKHCSVGGGGAGGESFAPRLTQWFTPHVYVYGAVFA